MLETQPRKHRFCPGFSGEKGVGVPPSGLHQIATGQGNSLTRRLDIFDQGGCPKIAPSHPKSRFPPHDRTVNLPQKHDIGHQKRLKRKEEARRLAELAARPRRPRDREEHAKV